ncbi:hypothetical protein PINS_up005378 [Pythium insidiosum]|nr:hypothetical protein PINS_up005378 [Pythium insidiosum]
MKVSSLHAVGPCGHDVVPRRSLAVLVTWLAVYALHALCACYFIAAGALYAFLPSTYLVFYFESNALTVPVKYFGRIAAGHIAIAVLHVIALVFPLLERALPPLRRSLFSCHECHRVVPSSSIFTSSSCLASSIRRLLASLRTSTQRLLWAPRTLHRMLLVRNGLLGVESRHFEVVFLAREAVETMLQTYQAYRMSRLLPRVWLNRTYVALLVLNAWSTPALHLIVPHNTALQRTLCLLTDLLLGVASTVGVSTLLALPYVRIYRPELLSFPNVFIYTDHYLLQWINETQIVLFSSWIDAASRLLYSLSLLGCLQDIKALLRSNNDHSHSHDLTNCAATVVPERVASSFHSSQRRGTRRVVYALMLMHGAFVLAVHLHAELKAEPPSCVLELRPWFVRRPACAFIELSCHPKAPQRLSRGGRADEIAVTLSQVHTASLVHVAIRHCAAVEMPPLVQSLTALIGAKLYNSTVVSWPLDAAFDAERHRHLRLFYAVRTTFPNGTLPEGLRSPRFPPLLLDVELSVSNVAWLPDDLDASWPLGMTLYIEHAQLAHVPAVLYRLVPYVLVLSGNPLTDVPAELIMLEGLDTLVVRELNVSRLPSDGVNASHNTLTWFFFDYTRIEVFPDWMDAAFVNPRLVSGGCTPACKRLLVQGVPPERPWLASIDCATCGLESTMFYPMQVDERPEDALSW